INDSAGGWYTTDLKDQGSGNNYTYDLNGQLKQDLADSVTAIDWTVYGKIDTIVNGRGTITYTYDAAGNRITKAAGGTNSIYVRDAQGNILAIYTQSGSGAPAQTEVDLYGSSRLGTVGALTVAPTSFALSGSYGTAYLNTFSRGEKSYELTNHLGNVLSTITDKKIAVSSASDSSLIDHFMADVAMAQDYYPFGMVMPGRTYPGAAASSYRWGFNGKEKNDEIEGAGNEYDYGRRGYDTRTGRFWSVDPLTLKYPWYTPYQFSGNSPIVNLDKDGEEEFHYTITLNSQGKTFLTQGRTEENNHHNWFGYRFDTKIQGERYVVNYSGNTYYIGFASDKGRSNNWKVAQFKQFLKDPDVQYFLNTFDDEKTERTNALVSDMQIAAISALAVSEHLQTNLNNSKASLPEPQQESTPGVGAMRRLEYEPASYHGREDNAIKSKAPTNGQDALDMSVQVKETSPRRVGIDYEKKEFVVFDRTQGDKYHGHVRSWQDLHTDMQNALKKAGMVDNKGNILTH
ncbi:MAG TPA: RHS repeat-associated core domain-containing protein, partial [Puia sp.]|nr:RHS repeat-associated core domain-containing protein [Puia sp.]